MGITNWSIKHWVTILVLIFVLTLAGLVSYQGLPREAAPDITIPVVLVTTPYIGVSPADVEKLVTQPLEDELQQLKDVREMRSTSADGASIITIEFEPDVDVDDALQKIRERVDAAEPELPDNLTDQPQVTEISFSEFPIMIINVSGNVGLAQLKQNAEQLQEKLERINGVLEVKLVGGLEREISVEADPDLLEYYRVSLGEVVGAIQRENLNMPGGTVELGDLKYSVRVPGEFSRVSELEDVVIREEEGQPIRVSDVATVVDGWEDRKTYSRVEGLESLSLSVSRRAGENVLRIASEAKTIIDEFEQTTGDSVHYTVVGDVSKHINDQVHELENNILTGLILVAAVLLFFMGGLRNALFVAAAIPLSMLVSFSVLAALDITLNIVVLFSLVLALGMLVDNAIVIVENIYRHANMGKSTVQAARDGTGEVAWPVIASTATTVFAFFPMLFWPGIMGEFMYYLPLTVIVVLSSSLFVALVINPVFCALFMRVKRSGDAGETDETDEEGGSAETHGAEGAALEPTADEAAKAEFDALPRNLVYRFYGASLRFALKHRWLVAVAVPLIFVATFAAYGASNPTTEFFPETTPERIYLNVTLPDGSNLDASDRIVRASERLLVGHDDIIDTWVADVGAGNGNQMNFGSGGTAPHRSRITVEFLPKEEQTESPFKLIDQLREQASQLPGAEVEIVKAENGPPTGPPVNIELVGNDVLELSEIAERVKKIIKDVPDLVNLKDNIELGRAEVTVRVDDDAASELKLSTQDIANTVRLAVNGMDASVFRDEQDEYDIVVQLNEESRNSIEDLSDLRLKNKDGEMVPISEVASVQVERGFGSIRHIDGDRVVTVSAEATDSTKADAVLKEVQSRLDSELELPPGYDLRYTGQNEEQANAQDFLFKALMAALFLIALVLVTQFNSVLQPSIILVSVVLSLLGVLWMLMLRDLPFGVIMTGVGIISLAGVVVNNAIVLIDYINQLKERGVQAQEAVFIAGMVRFRPVMLTAVTTILSLMPIVLGFSLDVQNFKVVFGGRSVEMWGPMANAVVGGLLVATVLTLIVVPVMYSGIDSFRGLLSRTRDRVLSRFGRGSGTSDVTDSGAQPSAARLAEGSQQAELSHS